MNILEHNGSAWNHQVESGNEWTKPVTADTVERARRGEWEIILTPTRPVPSGWFPDLKDSNVLCLASGGGQQGPVLAAAGAKVTVFDYSDKQLAQDRYAAERDGLQLTTVQGNMADLSCFADASFDFIVHPVSNVFAENILPVWKEAARVLKTGGTLIAGFMNPLVYIFDVEAEEQGQFVVKHSIPYADITDLSQERLERQIREHTPLEFGHSLEDQIQGQIEAGLVITGFYEDHFGGKSSLDPYINTFIATKSVKMKA
ncbi:class I SAM-dependent methyltransferase [Paenibacillus thalictri]|uniref:Class I SAM-dependent methyltransferase n=1 Tax=Paenibacillus thalictri TaxID=2527873 RepID=A0A4Q9DVN8_9BACL|nr:class I SAM-dependent methyltransferase [Paenibacillus thalictri]TBL80425.1 class I SAM-dependent methyltransferase [Paenibacillus thalictri]